MFPQKVHIVFSNNVARIYSGISTKICNRQLAIRCQNVPTILSIQNLIFAKNITANKCPSLSTSSTITRQDPGPVRLGFVPDEWFMFFYKKTGVSGAGTFCATLMITLMSKEIYVLEHEYYGGLSMFILCVLATKYIGPVIAKAIDDEIDEYEKSWNDVKDYNKKELENVIAHETKQQFISEGQLMLIEAKRENVLVQLEAAYRERLMYAYLETKKRLEYCLAREAIEKAVAKRCMADWVIEQVRTAVTKNIQEQALSKCFEDLKDLAKTYEGLSAPYKPADSPTDDEPPSEPPKKPKS